MAEVTNILTPPGRLVGGDPFQPQTKDAEGRPLIIKTGPNAGQPRVDYYIGLAIPKNDPGWPELWAKIHGEAKQAFPSLFDAAGNCINPQFAFKVIDGDSQVPNSKGVKPCDKQGYPGHWVLGFSGGFAPKCYTTGAEQLITDPSMIKKGYYIRVYGTVKGNESQQQPGVYLNHRMVELVGYGEEIITGPDGKAIFGAAPAALPAGASATPVAPPTSIAQPAPAAAPTVPASAPGVAQPAPAATPAQVPGPAPAGVTPAPDFLNPPAGAPGGPAPVVEKYQTSDGGAWTKEQLIAAGYTEAQIQALPRV